MKDYKRVFICSRIKIFFVFVEPIFCESLLTELTSCENVGRKVEKGKR